MVRPNEIYRGERPQKGGLQVERAGEGVKNLLHAAKVRKNGRGDAKGNLKSVWAKKCFLFAEDVHEKM